MIWVCTFHSCARIRFCFFTCCLCLIQSNRRNSNNSNKKTRSKSKNKTDLNRIEQERIEAEKQKKAQSKRDRDERAKRRNNNDFSDLKPRLLKNASEYELIINDFDTFKLQSNEYKKSKQKDRNYWINLLSNQMARDIKILQVIMESNDSNEIKIFYEHILQRMRALENATIVQKNGSLAMNPNYNNQEQQQHSESSQNSKQEPKSSPNNNHNNTNNFSLESNVNEININISNKFESITKEELFDKCKELEKENEKLRNELNQMKTEEMEEKSQLLDMESIIAENDSLKQKVQHLEQLLNKKQNQEPSQDLVVNENTNKSLFSTILSKFQ